MTPHLAVVAVVSFLSAIPLAAQVPPAVAVTAPLPPATKMEAFKPAAGTAVTMAYTKVGNVGGVIVSARQVKSSSTSMVRGLVVDVAQSEYRRESAFVDPDEIAELLRGIDHILATKVNPSPGFKDFEERYTTRGELQITAYSSESRVKYVIQAGRVLTAQRFFDDEDSIREFRDFIAAAQTVLAGAGQQGR